MTNDVNPPSGVKGINPTTPSRPTSSRMGEGSTGTPGGFGAGIQRPGSGASQAATGSSSALGAAAGRTAAGNFGSSKTQENTNDASNNTELVMSIPVEVQIVLGSTTMPVANLMNLGRGSVITLNKQIGDPIDIVVNGRIIARGEVIVLEDDSSRFGVSLTEVIDK
ncbi:flagellar motor switch protein FliN [Bartonella bacilliformis str. Heidi Mejia]|nr:flagellar motor switch protein fliY [Bartonella bacilliformis INS]EYS88612.1 flagellar motor switch protein FliN [Bartonella bacilliformis San Pedro600-02]EYS91036.1 flagellar motor switch protein FliN [Bartonella bacilliformis str. Heidi Mejia]EYS94410.1 flagellar motor switch protein FliN [Bartonella bacilliformis Peru-18]KEG15897.1 flagellar motor switch protein FliN [Bartonella bacilliformis CUSCO5]KEG16154.1 flagellar motor switch protein FliN [Bartonella bacilliformis Cond044]KEG1814